jgi:hypothetical protein
VTGDGQSQQSNFNLRRSGTNGVPHHSRLVFTAIHRQSTIRVARERLPEALQPGSRPGYQCIGTPDPHGKISGGKIGLVCFQSQRRPSLAFCGRHQNRLLPGPERTAGSGPPTAPVHTRRAAWWTSAGRKHPDYRVRIGVLHRFHRPKLA